LAPYANEVSLRTYLGEGDRENELRKVLEEKWTGLAKQYCDTEGLNLFLGHFFFVKEGTTPEKEPESERPILHVGGTQALYTSNIPSQIQYAALGHLHRYHATTKSPFPVVYSSSPLAYSFSEAGQEKQVVLITGEPNKPVDYKPIPLKQGRKLERKKFNELDTALKWLEENPNCFVELTYETENSIDAATRKSLLQAHDGIINLIPHIKNLTEDANDELQVEDLDKDMNSLFNMYYKSEKGQLPNEELMSIFREILSQDNKI
jgi:exonuclease SbcD